MCGHYLLKQDKENEEKFDLRRHLSWCPWINAVSDKRKCISERLCHYLQLELKKKRRSDSEVGAYSRLFDQSIHVTLSCSWMFHALTCKSLTQNFVSSSLCHFCQNCAIDDGVCSYQQYIYKQYSMVVLQSILASMIFHLIWEVLITFEGLQKIEPAYWRCQRDDKVYEEINVLITVRWSLFVRLLMVHVLKKVDRGLCRFSDTSIPCKKWIYQKWLLLYMCVVDTLLSNLMFYSTMNI